MNRIRMEVTTHGLKYMEWSNFETYYYGLWVIWLFIIDISQSFWKKKKTNFRVKISSITLGLIFRF